MDDQNEPKDFQQKCLGYLDGVLQAIQSFGRHVYILDDAHLSALNIRRAEPLDIEEECVDFGPRFFCPRFTLQQARQKTGELFADHAQELGDGIDWPKRCRRGSFVCFYEDPSGPFDSEEPHPLCDPRTDADFRLEWFLNAAGARSTDPFYDTPNRGVWDGSGWYCLNEVDLVRNETGNLPMHCPCDIKVGTPPRYYEFHVNKALLLGDHCAEEPHIGATVVDSTEAGEGEVLRSEVAAAVGLLKHQFRRGDFRLHHTLPVIVFSFQHDRSGRVSQFHFNGRALIMRQSRLLDFRSDEPTTDAYHMIRWMGNRPIGETRFRDAAVTESEEPKLRDIDKNKEALPVDVRGT